MEATSDPDMNKMDEDMKSRKYQMNILELKTYSSLLRT